MTLWLLLGVLGLAILLVTVALAEELEDQGRGPLVVKIKSHRAE